MSDTAQALAALTQRIDRQSLQIAEMHALLLAPPMPRAAREDRLRLVSLLPPLWAAFGDSNFRVSELLEAANLAPNAPLAAAAADIVATRGAIDPSRCIGKFLAKHEGVVCAGLYVARIGDDRGSALWSVRVSD